MTVAFSPDGKLVAAGSDTGAILVFDLESGGKLLKSIVPHEDAVTSLEFSPDGQFILTASDDSSLAISSVESGEPVVLHGDFAGDVTSMALNSDATIAAIRGAVRGNSGPLWSGGRGRVFGGWLSRGQH